MKWAILGCLLASATVEAQTAAPAPLAAEVSQVRTRYDFGQFAEVEVAAQALLDKGGLTAAQLAEIHLYAGLAAFNLNASALAERHFVALLRADPEARLDPFLAPPPALRAFEAVRQRMAPELAQAATARAAEAQARAQAQAAEASREQRQKLEASAREASMRQAQGRSLWVDFIPFGAGQFQQGRTGAGIAFATSELVLALTSVVTFLVYNGLQETRTLTVNNELLGGNGSIPITGIPRSRQRTADILRWTNLGSSIGFYGVYAGGVAEALIRHREGEPPPQAAPSTAGATAGFTLHF